MWGNQAETSLAAPSLSWLASIVLEGTAKAAEEESSCIQSYPAVDTLNYNNNPAGREHPLVQ